MWLKAPPLLLLPLPALQCGYKKGTDKLYLRLPQVPRLLSTVVGSCWRVEFAGQRCRAACLSLCVPSCWWVSPAWSLINLPPCPLDSPPPQEVRHTIDAGSPLASWLEPGGLSEDADSEIVVVVSYGCRGNDAGRMEEVWDNCMCQNTGWIECADLASCLLTKTLPPASRSCKPTCTRRGPTACGNARTEWAGKGREEQDLMA